MFFLVVFTILVTIFIISLQSEIYISTFIENLLLCSSNSSQYIVSRASLLAIDILCAKSALLSAAKASLTLAPILVAARKNCFEIINSLISVN